MVAEKRPTTSGESKSKGLTGEVVLKVRIFVLILSKDSYTVFTIRAVLQHWPVPFAACYYDSKSRELH